MIRDDDHDQPKAGLWTNGLNKEEREEMIEWAVPIYDIVREYIEENLMISDAETGEFSYLIIKSDDSLSEDIQEKLKTMGIKIIVFENIK